MTSFGNFISTLQEQFGPTVVVSLLFGAATILGIMFGASLMGLFAGALKRRSFKKITTERDELRKLLQNSQSNAAGLQAEKDTLSVRHVDVEVRDELQKSLQNSEANSARLQAEKDTLNAKHNGSDELISRQVTRIATLTAKLTAAETLAAQHEAAQRELVKREAARREEAKREEVRRKDAQRKEAQVAKVLANEAKAPPTLIKRVPSADESSLSYVDTGMIPDDQIIPIMPEAELTANVEAYDLSDLEDLVGQDV